MTIALETVQTVPLTQTPEGVIRVTGTRLPLDTILHHYKQGASAEEISNRFPAVSLAQVHAILSYYLNHQAELDAYLQEQDKASEAFQKQLEANPQYQANRVAFRERLMQRWAARQLSNPVGLS
jgi:uncharacterized protein (DUF433 family)